jgi:hypothetical protein
VRGVCFSHPRQYFSRPRRCHARVPTFACVRVRPGGASVRRAPRAWAHLRRSGRALRLVCTPLRPPPLAGQRGDVPMTPIERVANNGSLVELLTGSSSGLPCPVDRGRLVVRRHVHKSTLRGCARQGSVPFDWDRGRGSSPSVDPSTSCPRWPRTRTMGRPRACEVEIRLKCVHPGRSRLCQSEEPIRPFEGQASNL